MDKKKKVVIHVLGYHALNHLKNGSLEQIIAAANQLTDCRVKVVFQDNYSQDGSINYVLDDTDVDVLLSTKNYMYDKAVNYGIQYIERYYQPDYIILADADNYCHLEAYCKLFEYMESNSKVGIVQPLVKSMDEEDLLYSCGHVYAEGVFCRPMKILPENAAFLSDLESCSICSSMIRMDVLRKIGLLNPVFDIYYESSDLCFRIRKHGFKCACCTEAVVYNKGTVANHIDNYHEAYYRIRNGLIFWKITDQEKYSKMKALIAERYHELTEHYLNCDYCTDSAAEAERKGIEDGIHMCETIGISDLAPFISIEHYEKWNLIVLQKKDDNL